MALKPRQKESIRVAYTSDYYDADNNPKGKSNRAIAKEAECSESAVRTFIKKLIEEGVEKNALNALAEREVHTTIIQDEINEKKSALTNAEKNAYNEVFNTKKKTIDIATGFQDIITLRQEADNMAIDTLIEIKAKQLKEAKKKGDIDEVLRINMKFRDYMSVIADYKDIKDGVEANDKASITKGEAPRFAPKADTTVNNLTITDTEAGTKGKW